MSKPIAFLSKYDTTELQDLYVEKVLELYASGEENAFDTYLQYGAQAEDETDLEFIEYRARKDIGSYLINHMDIRVSPCVYQEVIDEMIGSINKFLKTNQLPNELLNELLFRPKLFSTIQDLGVVTNDGILQLVTASTAAAARKSRL